jgi:alpha,alpha-trehalose phosphorylase
MRQTPEGLSFAPRLSSGFSRLTFHMRYRGRLIRLTVTRHEATYELVDGEELTIHHFGEPVTLGDKATRQKIPAIEAGPRPRQPKSREPITHR